MPELFVIGSDGELEESGLLFHLKTNTTNNMTIGY